MIRLGIIGMGNIARTHISNILSGQCPDFEITALAAQHEDRRALAAQLVPGAAFFADGMALIASGLCDAVLITSPHDQHPAQTIAALDAGLHVLCEKPAGVHIRQARAMIACADRHPDLAFGMVFNQRTNSVYRRIKELMDAGELGALKRVNWIVTDWYRTQQYYDSGTWRATWAGEGGGVMLNQCPHQLDLLQWLCGMPVRVHAFTHEGKWHDVEVEDDVTAYFEFAGGATGVFVTTTGDAPGSNRLEITGTRGRLICEDGRLIFDRLLEDERTWCASCPQGFEKPPMERIELATDGLNTQHAGVLNAFADCIERGGALVADGREGINSLMLSNAVYLSGWTGETVELPIDEERFLELLDRHRAASRYRK